MASDFQMRGQKLFFINLRPNVEDTLTNAGPGAIVIIRDNDELKPRILGMFAFCHTLTGRFLCH